MLQSPTALHLLKKRGEKGDFKWYTITLTSQKLMLIGGYYESHLPILVLRTPLRLFLSMVQVLRSQLQANLLSSSTTWKLGIG